MTNVIVKQEGNELVIRVDLTQEHGPSKSGKTTNIAKTGGFQCVSTVEGQPVYLDLNVYKSRPKPRS